MPAVDRATGKVLLAAKDRVALSPDGHGGTLAALAAPGPRRDAQLPGRDARARRADALLFSGRQPSGPDRRAGLHRPASRGGRRDVVQGRRAALARRKAGRGRDRRRPSAGDRVFRPASPSWQAGECPKGRSSSGRAASPSIFSSGRSSSGWWANSGCRSIARSRRSLMSTTAGEGIKPAEPNAVKFEQFIFDALPRAERVGDRRDRPGRRVRAAQERGRPRLAGDRAPADERPVRQLARAGRRRRFRDDRTARCRSASRSVRSSPWTRRS